MNKWTNEIAGNCFVVAVVVVAFGVVKCANFTKWMDSLSLGRIHDTIDRLWIVPPNCSCILITENHIRSEARQVCILRRPDIKIPYMCRLCVFVSSARRKCNKPKTNAGRFWRPWMVHVRSVPGVCLGRIGLEFCGSHIVCGIVFLHLCLARAAPCSTFAAALCSKRWCTHCSMRAACHAYNMRALAWSGFFLPLNIA